MVGRVFLHIGMPKTGTTYLQDILWSHREELRADGLVLPGSGHREHLWAALDVQRRGRLERRHPSAPGTFERFAVELEGLDGVDGLISHEFLCGANRAQARRTVERLAPAEVHVVVTARDTAGMLAAGWQEMVKNGSKRTLREAAADIERRDLEFSWATWDLAGILRRWSAAVPPERVHVLPLPARGEPRTRHWEAFAGVLGVGTGYEGPASAANPSLGAVEVELLRRINVHLTGFKSPTARGAWIRGYLAEKQLRSSGAEPFGLDPDLLEDCRVRARRAVRMIEKRGFHVVGDLSRLLVPEDLPDLRTVDSVTEAELIEASGVLVGGMLEDVRDLSARVAGADPGDADADAGDDADDTDDTDDDSGDGRADDGDDGDDDGDAPGGRWARVRRRLPGNRH